MRTSPLDLAGSRAAWVSDAAEGGTCLEWRHGSAPPARVPFSELRWSADLLAGSGGPGWAAVLPQVVDWSERTESWVFHASRLKPMHDLHLREQGRWSVYRWAGDWVIDFHRTVGSRGVTMPLLVALTAVLGCFPSAIR
jgi:hypothetical protein